MKRAAQDANVMIKNNPGMFKNIVILSQDVRALYPSLNIEETIRITYEAVMESEVEFENI